MPKRIGVVFASTGGPKLARALRSLRRTEPDLPIHVVLDVSSNTWKESGWDTVDLMDSLQIHDTKITVRRDHSNTAYINGTLNEAMAWMMELGYDYGCLFHDDVIFSPLPENKHHLTNCFTDFLANYGPCSGASLGYMQAFSDRTEWRRSPVEWDKMDLESEELWRKLLPEGRPIGYWRNDTPVPEIQLENFFAQFYTVEHGRRTFRLGPPGQIVPVWAWQQVRGFDEEYGIFYDEQYPADCALQGMPPIYTLPNVPHLHLHNQSIGYADPAVGLWGNHPEAFKKKFGKETTAFWLDYQ